MGNEDFRGTVLDEQNMDKWMQMRELAREITELTTELRSPFFPFDNHDKSARVVLRGQHPVALMDKRVNEKISELFTLADFVTLAIPEGTDEIQMCFVIGNMWKEWKTVDECEKET